MFSKQTIYCTIFQQRFTSISPVFTHKLVKKKLGEMLIQQIIEFELRGLDPLAVHVLL